MDMEERIKALEAEVQYMRMEVDNLHNHIWSLQGRPNPASPGVNPYSPQAHRKPSAPF